MRNVLATITILILFAWGSPGSFVAQANELPVASAARVAGDSTRTRFVADLSETVSFNVSVLADPYRVIIDMPQTRFDLPRGAGQEGRGLVDVWRYGLFAPGKSRVVLDTNQPVKIDKSFILPPIDDQPARMVIDLVKTSRDFFLEEVKRTAAKREDLEAGQARKSDRKSVRDAGKSTRPVVVIDPGHGGLDTGARGSSGVLEKSIVLNFSSILKRKLEESGAYDVFLTREDDRFLSLSKRVDYARGKHADLFISIHADSVNQKYVRGATVYTLSETASDDVARALAEKENKSDLIAGIDLEKEPDDVSDILIDLARRETRNFSALYSRLLVKEMSGASKMIKNPRRSAGFIVLKAPDIPSVLVELGYLSNKLDEKLLISEEWQARAAEAVLSSVNNFFRPRLAKSEE
ncbi:MAG: N-acetylmuramoyl-L-alanine amidase [Stappiaceae bacterium]